MPHNYTRREGQCTNTWDDGWGHHECQRAAGHQFDATYPRCMCDCDDMVTHPDQPRPNTKEQNIAFRKQWDADVEAGSRRIATPKEPQ